MIKGLIRLCGFLLVAAGFVAVVIDGTRSIAASTLHYTALQDTVQQFSPTALSMLSLRLVRIHPVLWDPIVKAALLCPTALALVLFGVVFLLFGRKRREQIGFPARI